MFYNNSLYIIEIYNIWVDIEKKIYGINWNIKQLQNFDHISEKCLILDSDEEEDWDLFEQTRRGKNKQYMLENAKKTKTYKKIKEIFDDAELVDVKNEEIND